MRIKEREAVFYQTLNIDKQKKQQMFGDLLSEYGILKNKQKEPLVLASDPIAGVVVMKEKDYKKKYLTDPKGVDWKKLFADKNY